jgi:hypothetical protein
MTSCYYDEIFEPELPEGTVVSFDADIVPIIADSNCANCHNGTQNPDLRPGNEYNSLVPDYVEAGNADNSLFYTKLSNEGHGGVGPNALILIEEWINSGALNN